VLRFAPGYLLPRLRRWSNPQFAILNRQSEIENRQLATPTKFCNIVQLFVGCTALRNVIRIVEIQILQEH
jgi:hypothetical protein